MNTIKYFIIVMKAPKHVYGGLGGKLRHFKKMLKCRQAIRQNGGKGLW